MSKQKKWSSPQKFEIALLAIKNETTINDIFKKYEVAPCQVYELKKQLFEQGANLLEKNGKSNLSQSSVDYKDLSFGFS